MVLVGDATLVIIWTRRLHFAYSHAVIKFFTAVKDY